MKHVFILNPAAGKGLAEKQILPVIQKASRENDCEFDIHRSLNKNEIVSYVRQKAASGDEVRFYACGGDGTINDVLSGMAEFPNAQLAVIPCGSGNDFAKNFTEPKNFLDIEKQLNGHVEKVDVIKYNDLYCINMLNIGADCDVVSESIELKKKNPKMGGPLAYFLGALKVLTGDVRYRMEYVDENGQAVEEDLMLTAVANGKWCGGGFRSCPQASIRDGLMDIGIVRPVKGLKMFRLLMEYRAGTHLQDKDAEKYIKYLRLPEFTLKPLDEFNVSIDGEINRFEAAHFKVLPEAVSFVVPEGSKIID